jgi:hydroxymethylglutaryl-CoA reductase (NADPH)
MSVTSKTAKQIRDRLLGTTDVETCRKRLQPRLPADYPLKERVPAGNDHTYQGLSRRQDWLRKTGVALDALSGRSPAPDPASLAGNIENLIGFSQVPVGVIGPLRINGTEAHGDYYVPLATTEGALVASCHRGAYAISQAGGATVMCLTEAVTRAPCFVFERMVEACQFLEFVIGRASEFQALVSKGSRHCRLVDFRPTLAGKTLYLGFEYQTGDAAGQNMVTLATDALCRFLVEASPVKPRSWYVEGNMSGDKKATMLSFLTARGKKVIAEAIIPARLLQRAVHVTPAEFVRYGHVATMGGALSGSIGVQGHYANPLAALFIACGQDAACVSEAAIGMTDMTLTERGDLQVCVSLPNLIVGTVGGGTHLPTARECLDMLGCSGEKSSRRFAEICAATVLAAEISIIAALAAGQFTAAHAKYGRRKK